MKCYYKMRREMRQQRILKYTLLVFMLYATLFVLKDIILLEEENLRTLVRLRTRLSSHSPLLFKLLHFLIQGPTTL